MKDFVVKVILFEQSRIIRDLILNFTLQKLIWLSNIVKTVL